MIPILLFYGDDQVTKVSWWDDWLEGFTSYPAYQVEAHNLYTDSYKGILKRIDSFELIVFLHSAMINRRPIPPDLKYAIADRKKAEMLYFIGNEFKLFPQLVAGLNELRTEYIASQLPLESAKWVYEYAVHTKAIIPIPPALNPKIFHLAKPFSERPIDIGVRCYRYTRDVFDEERNVFVELFRERFPHFRKDISTDVNQRFTASEWPVFLSNCRGTVSTAAGASYLDRDSTLFENMRYECRKDPDTPHDVLHQKIYQHERAPSGKCLSLRHLEAISTKTVNILLEDDYNGILKPDVHYIAVKRDFSNLDEAMAKFADDAYCQKLVDHAREDLLDGHTYQHRFDLVHNTIFGG